MASLREVADAAGVGLGTASRALNGTGYVSEEKKKMILKAAEELHYRQNMSVPEPAKEKQVSLVFLYRIWNSRFLQVF